MQTSGANGFGFRQAAVFCALVGVAIASRLVQELIPAIPPNFAAVAAAGMFAGYYFRSRLVAALVPLVAMTISDRLIGGYEGEVMAVVYAALTLPVLMRGMFARSQGPARVMSAALVSSTVFYAMTNLAVWHCYYEPTAAEFVRCYTVALPFAVYTIAGDMLYSLGLFGLHRVAVTSGTKSCLAPAVAS